MQVSSKLQRSQWLNHQLPPTIQWGQCWLFSHGSPSNFLYEVSTWHHSCRTRRWRQTPRTRWWRAQQKEERKRKWQGLFASENNFPHSKICMLTIKLWALNFAGKQVDQHPQWNNRCKWCPCWFLQKYCFSNCPNKESNIKSREVPATILQNKLVWIKARHNWRFGSESSNVQPSKKTPNINNPTTTKPNPNLLDRLSHQIHHQLTSQNTPVLRANDFSAQTPQPKQPGAVNVSSIAGSTCLGEYLPLESTVFSSREKATVGRKKQKFPSTTLDLRD